MKSSTCSRVTQYRLPAIRKEPRKTITSHNRLIIEVKLTVSNLLFCLTALSPFIQEMVGLGDACGLHSIMTALPLVMIIVFCLWLISNEGADAVKRKHI